MACTYVAAEFQIVTDMTDISVQKYLQVGVKSLREHVILQNQFNFGNMRYFLVHIVYFILCKPF